MYWMEIPLKSCRTAEYAVGSDWLVMLHDNAVLLLSGHTGLMPAVSPGRMATPGCKYPGREEGPVQNGLLCQKIYFRLTLISFEPFSPPPATYPPSMLSRVVSPNANSPPVFSSILLR